MVLGGVICSAGVFALWPTTRYLMTTFHKFQAFQGYRVSASLMRSNQAGREAGGKAGDLRKPRLVAFRLFAPAAQKVFLGGTFNDFDAKNHGLRRMENGIWEITLELLPGQYLYKFKVDGRWELDPANPQKTSGDRASSILNIF